MEDTTAPGFSLLKSLAIGGWVVAIGAGVWGYTSSQNFQQAVMAAGAATSKSKALEAELAATRKKLAEAEKQIADVRQAVATPPAEPAQPAPAAAPATPAKK